MWIAVKTALVIGDEVNAFMVVKIRQGPGRRHELELTLRCEKWGDRGDLNPGYQKKPIWRPPRGKWSTHVSLTSRFIASLLLIFRFPKRRTLSE